MCLSDTGERKERVSVRVSESECELSVFVRYWREQRKSECELRAFVRYWREQGKRV